MEPSVWIVSLKRNGREYSTEYTMGAAYRIWTGDKYQGRIVGPIGGWQGLTKYVGGKIPKRGDRVQCHRGSVPVVIAEMLQNQTAPEPPSLDGVVYALVMDAMGVRHGQTFEEWASEYGMDSDSRKAEKMYNQCINTWRALIRLGADLDNLEDMYADY